MNPAELERLIDRELKRLPAPPAPTTLLPRVLAATVQRKPAPWYSRPWLAWPAAWQVASLAALVAVGVGLVMAGPAVRQAVFAPGWWSSGTVPGRVAALARVLEQGSALVRALWVLLQPLTASLLIIAVSLSLACAAIWSALNRVALGGASQP